MSNVTLDIPHDVLTERLRTYLRRYYDFDMRLKAFENRRLFSLEVELTNRCNQECRYCYNSSTRNCRTRDLPLEFVTTLISEARQAGIRQIAWLGGEPTLYPHLEEVLETARQHGIENVLFTNGCLLTSKTWSQIGPHVSRLMFHLDTINPETFIALNNATRDQCREILTQTLDNLNNILASGFDSNWIHLYVVLVQPTLERLQETLQYSLKEKGLGTTVLFPMVRTGRASSTNRDWRLQPQQLRRAYELRSQMEDRPELLLLGPSEYCKHYQLTMAYIDIKGYLMPYAGMPCPRLNLGTANLSKTVSQNFAALSFADLTSKQGGNLLEGPCGKCENGDLCFGTRTTAFNATGAVIKSDPECWWGPATIV